MPHVQDSSDKTPKNNNKTVPDYSETCETLNNQLSPKMSSSTNLNLSSNPKEKVGRSASGNCINIDIDSNGYIMKKPEKSASCSRISNLRDKNHNKHKTIRIPSIILNRKGQISFVHDEDEVDDSDDDEEFQTSGGHPKTCISCNRRSRSSSRGRTRTRTIARVMSNGNQDVVNLNLNNVKGNANRTPSAFNKSNRQRSSRSNRREESPSVRIQVTLHKPLNWQVSACSSSSSMSNSTNLLKTMTSQSGSVKKSSSDSFSFSLSPSSTFSKDDSSDRNEEVGQGHNPINLGKEGNEISVNLKSEGGGGTKGKVRFTNLDHYKSRFGDNRVGGSSDKKDPDQMEKNNGNCVNSCGEDIKVEGDNDSLQNDNQSHYSRPGCLKHNFSQDFCGEIAQYRHPIDESSTDEDRDIDAQDGFEERNRLRSKSVRNRAHRRKKTPSKNKKKSGNSTFPEEKQVNRNKSSVSAAEEGKHIKHCTFRSGGDICSCEPEVFGSTQTTKSFRDFEDIENIEKSEDFSEFSTKGERGVGHHSSFVVRLPKQKSKGRKQEVNQSFDCERSYATGEGTPMVMTWFKGASSHDTNRESGMGANGSREVDGRLKSRSQSSSALYSGNGIDTRPSYSNNTNTNYTHLNCHAGNPSSNGLSTSIPADIWDLPPTTNSFSPLTHKHHYHYHPKSSTSTETQNKVKAVKDSGGKKMPSVVDAITCRGRKGGKSKNRAKLYAVSCPDVAQQAQCSNLDHHHVHGQGHPQQNQDFANISRLGTTTEEISPAITGGGATGILFPVGIVPEGYRSIKRSHQNQIHNQHQHQHQVQLLQYQFANNPVISNLQLTQSHPHLHLNPNPQVQVFQQGLQLQGQICPTHGPTLIQQQQMGPISQSYQNIPNIQNQFFLQQDHLRHQIQYQNPNGVSLQYQNNQSHNSLHLHNNQNQYKSSGALPLSQAQTLPQQSQVQRQRGSLPNQRSCDIPLQSQEGDLSPSTLDSIFPAFVIPENIFEVHLLRDQRGLGLSVTGGRDTQEKYPGLIRIKKVFPMSPASDSGRISSWDVILQANGVPLTGLSNHEALSVLRTSPTETVLTLCRPPPNVPGFSDVQSSEQIQTQVTLHQFPHQHLDTNTSSTNLPDPANKSHSHFPYNSYNQTHHQNQDGLQRHYQNENVSSFNPAAKSKSLSSLKIPTGLVQHTSFGEFEVVLEKVAGSLGFTLRQEDTSILGHYVRALVKDPALTDGRIQPGDRILSVNGHDLSEMSHAEAINYLRQCPPQVTLRMYRDTSPTPISPLSPSESHKSIKPKPLRQEAIDMLNDLAIRKQLSSSSVSGDPKYSLPGSAVGRTGLRSHKVSQHDANCPATLPRRRHAALTPSPQVLSAALSRFAGTSPQKSQKPFGANNATDAKSDQDQQKQSQDTSNMKSKSSHTQEDRIGDVSLGGSEADPNCPCETRSSGSGESTPVGTIGSKKNNFNNKNKKTDPYRAYNDLRSDSIISTSTRDFSLNDSNSDNDNELNESCNGSGSAEGNKRKDFFRQFTMHLDRISSLDEDGGFTSELNHHDSIVSEPGGKRDGSNFRHGQPAYQSAILPSTSNSAKSRNKLNKAFGSGFRLQGGDSPTTLSDVDIPSSYSVTDSATTTVVNLQKEGAKSQHYQQINEKEKSPKKSSSSSASDSNNPGSLMKWKGVLFSKEDEDDTETTVSSENLDSNLRKPVGSSSGSEHGKQSQQYLDVDERDSNLISQRRSPDGREFRECDLEISSTTQLDGEQIYTVQLSRRWCSRLGFSLQGANGHTYISAIYPDSVASKDGRLRVGDEVVMVNGETIRDLNTTEVIDNMRKIRGMISITILRKPDLSSSSNANTSGSDSELGLR